MRSKVSRWVVLAFVAIAGCGDGDASAPDASSARDDAAVIEADAGAIAAGWRVEPALPERIQEVTGAVHQGRLWIAGGFDASTTVTAAVRVFDPATGAWTEGPALPAPRHHAMMVSTGADLYLFGGMETIRFEPLDIAWVLRDGATDWEPITPLPETRGAGVAALVGDRIVIAGGNASRGGLAATTLRYDFAADRWETGAPIPSAREHLGGFAHEGELWVVAGRRNSLETNTDVVEIYDPATDTWRDGPAIPTARGGFGIAVLEGVAYAVGGEQPDRALTSVEALDLASGTWRESAPVPTPRHGHVVLAAAGRVWVVGGGDRPIFAAVDAVESFAPSE